MVLVSRLGWEQHKWEYNNPGYPFNLASIGIAPSLIAQLPIQSFPAISMTNYTSFGPGRNIGDEFNVSSTWAWEEVLTKIINKHSIKAGGNFWVMLNNQREPTSSFGSIGFTNAFSQQNALMANAASGNAFASFLLGYPASGSILNNQAIAYSSRYYAFFVQDDYRISSKLTINVGLRWDYESPITDRYNRLSAGFNPSAPNPIQAPGLPLYGGLLFVTPNNRLPYNRDLNNWQPRVGVAYHFLKNTVFRPGYGITYLPTCDLPSFSSFNTTTGLVASNDGGLTPAVNLSNPYPGGVVQPTGSSLGLATLIGQSISFGNPDRKIPYVHQFSAGFQQMLSWNAVLDISYVGSRTHDMQVPRNINALNPTYNSLGTGLTAQVPESARRPVAAVAGIEWDNYNATTLLLPFPQFQTITEMISRLAMRPTIHCS